MSAAVAFAPKANIEPPATHKNVFVTSFGGTALVCVADSKSRSGVGLFAYIAAISKSPYLTNTSSVLRC